MKKINIVLCYGLVLMLFGCTSAKRAALSSGDDPKAAVSEVTKLMEIAQQKQNDLLSLSEFTKGAEYVDGAKKSLSHSHKPELILEKASIAKAHFQEAGLQSEVRSAKAERILQARQSSLDAGLRDSDALVAELVNLDDDVRDETDNFSEALEPREFSEYQKKYFALEVKAVQFRELGAVKQAIEEASNKDADDVAPDSLKTAMLDLSESENLIAQSPRNPGIHEASVKKSVVSATLLTDVMDVISNAKGTPENIALRIVAQNRELGTLSKSVGTLEQNLQATKSNLSETEVALKLQEEALKKSSTQVRFQQAMEEVGRQFSEDEASVYQQGNNLIFRLKKINFLTGTATVPEASKPLLSKINGIIETIGAENVEVQGHSDSVGAANLNKTLSTKRASAVATYLSELRGGYKIGFIGYGETRPIASNETKEGRAINRRVDLVVTAKK